MGGSTARRVAFWSTVVGVVLVVASMVWTAAAIPALVRFPTDLDRTLTYEGVVRVHVDPTTLAPLSEPVDYPLTIERHVQSVASDSSTDRVVVDESLRLVAAGLFDTTQTNRYVMDRRSMENVADDRAYAFTDANVVDRSPAFRLTFPLSTDAETHTVYKNEIATTYEATPIAGSTSVAGLSVIEFEVDQAPVPISPAYQEALGAVVELPSAVPVATLEPLLAAQGIDLVATQTALLASLSPEDTSALLAILEAPVPIEYVEGFSGADAVEPTTGAIVEVSNVVESVGARPAPEVTAELVEILSHYPNVPLAVETSEKLQALAAEPIAVFENRFSQTEASVVDTAAQVADDRDQIDLVSDTVPGVLLALGIAGLFGGGLGLLLDRRRRRRV